MANAYLQASCWSTYPCHLSHCGESWVAASNTELTTRSSSFGEQRRRMSTMNGDFC